MNDFDLIEDIFKGILILITLPLWLPALLALKLFKILYLWVAE